METFESIVQWHKEIFPNATEESQLEKLAEEIEELLNARDVEIVKEMADVYIVTFALSRFSTTAFIYALDEIRTLIGHLDIDMVDKAIQKKMKLNRKRQWEEVEPNYYRHVEV